MIKNEKQYKITRNKLTEIQGEIVRIKAGYDEGLPAKERLILISLETMKSQMESEIAEYDFLKKKRADHLKARRISDLPSVIIEYKIHSGMTQKEFSQKIGMKEQQLQRYEAEDFRSISFKNLLKILQAIGLEIFIQETPITDEQKRTT
jgi:HTH-type transcriptional regulator/antitoxin HigA